MQNLARFWTTSKFGGEYLRNGWRYSKSDKYFVYRDYSRFRRNKSGELFPSNLENLRPEIFTRAREWQSLTSAPRTKDAGPLQFFSKGDQKLA